ncbi:MAG: hypothetical protein R6U98_23110, partial [Pirellulaceae bacterium]
PFALWGLRGGAEVGESASLSEAGGPGGQDVPQGSKRDPAAGGVLAPAGEENRGRMGRHGGQGLRPDPSQRVLLPCGTS